MKTPHRVVLLALLAGTGALVWYSYQRAVSGRAAAVERLKAVSDARAAEKAARDSAARESADGDAAEGAVVPGWPGVASVGHVIGQPNAPVRIVVFGDYLCPHCRNMAPTIRALAEAYRGQLAIVYRNFPIFGARSWTTAMAAECAARQGRFLEAYLALNRGLVLSSLDWPGTLVREAGIPNAGMFRQCLNGEQTRERVAADHAAAVASGASGTPAILINGRLYQGELSLQDLQPLIEEALAHPR